MQRLTLTCCFLLSSFTLLPACAWQKTAHPQDTQLDSALQEYTRAKSTSTHDADDNLALEQLTSARLTYIVAALEGAAQLQRAGEWLPAKLLLDKAVKNTPDSQRLVDAREQVETELSARLRSNDCQLGAARAHYLSQKLRLLELRTPLDTKDYLQDWKSSRERQELDQLAEQLRDCTNAALDDNQLLLAEVTLAAATPIHGPNFVAAEQQRLDQLKQQAAPIKPTTVKQRKSDSPQQRIRKAHIALQSAMTRGDLRQAKARIAELRKLSGDTPQLLELDKSVSDAIAAYIGETHDRANTLYRAQQIEAARDLWQKILELDPDDAQARTNLERAERVLKKLEELKGNLPEATSATP